MEVIRGFVYRTIYSNTQNTYCVFVIKDYNDEYITCTARMEGPKEGEDLELKGRFVEHEKYGYQFNVSSMEKLKPDNMGAARLYLANLGVKGLGDRSIEKILDYFGLELLDLLRSDRPEAIKEVPGLRQGVKEELFNTLLGEGILSDLNHFFEDHGISAKWSKSVYQYYGAASVDVMTHNPYALLQVAEGVNFSVADTLAKHIGIEADDQRRIEAGISWLLNHIEDRGHTCLPVDQLIGAGVNLLGDIADPIADYIEECINIGQLYSVDQEGILYVYPPNLYIAEMESAQKTLAFLGQEDPVNLDMERFLGTFEDTQGIRLGDVQKEAIDLALTQSLALITGGPGTGKTTIIKALVEGFQLGGLSRILLCAPTGRAAKRLTEATDYEATTIHRLLMPVQGSDSYDFQKNEEDPLEADVVIIDEASMLNIRLYHSLLRAIPENCHVVIVGDVDQLPPIGAGFVLKDLLESDCVPFSRLNQIYRQDSGNAIISNAYAINQGNMPDLTGSDEFVFIPVTSMASMMKAITETYKCEKEDLDDELDMQIISPMRRGDAGSLSISKFVQEAVNPPAGHKGEVRANGITYRVGDKVIQASNNYELDVFNGEIGCIYAISKTDVLIRFVHKDIRLSLDDIHTIMPAYAITVHKAQGSEYGTVIIPFIPNYGIMLQRNLLYTAVTRARRKVIIIGTESAIKRAVSHVNRDSFYTLFKERIQGRCVD
ncbi:MAG: ATP-dependent RecD-like DNA helicase [Veillonella sp.]|nr:ATP-dependent RecD-like DNA helicase [Veillonella sp.]